MIQMCVIFEGLPLNSPEFAGLMISAVGFAFLETIKSKTISHAVDSPHGGLSNGNIERPRKMWN